MKSKPNSGNLPEEKKEGVFVGTVREALPNTLFRVKAEDGREFLAYLSGRMRLHRIRVLVGDAVEMVTDAYGSRARIVKRL
jgi:translation initiation factor IF-1